jgi:REP element-mobilizing transposase RayT
LVSWARLGNIRSVCFHAEEDYQFYRHTLKEVADRFGCALHAYVLMTNHVHLLLTPHDEYRRLGKTDAERRDAYRALFRAHVDEALTDEIRDATNGNFALGDQRFQDQIAQVLGRRVVRGKAGRPVKVPEPESGGLFQAGNEAFPRLTRLTQIHKPRVRRSVIDAGFWRQSSTATTVAMSSRTS